MQLHWARHIGFKSDNHLIINELYEYIVYEMPQGKTIKEVAVAVATGVHRNIVNKREWFSSILSRYTYVNDKGKFSFTNSNEQVTILVIDECKSF